MDKKLFIHIGSPKTGSSAIQNSLLQNNLFLKDNGIAFLEYSLYHHAKNLQCIDIEDKNALLNERWKTRHEINQLSSNNVVLSNEGYLGVTNNGLSNCDEMARKLEFVTSGFDRKIIVYLRRQDEYFESIYGQKIKEGASWSFKEFLNVVDIESYGWLDALRPFERYFGKENIIVRIYEKQQLINSDVVADFFKTISLDANDPSFIPSNYQNKSYSRSALEVAIILNKFLKTKEAKQKLRNRLQYASGANKYGNFCFFTYNEREKLLSFYKKDHEKIAKEYLRRDDGILFHEKINKYKEMEHREIGIMLRDINNVVTDVIVRPTIRRLRSLTVS